VVWMPLGWLHFPLLHWVKKTVKVGVPKGRKPTGVTTGSQPAGTPLRPARLWEASLGCLAGHCGHTFPFLCDLRQVLNSQDLVHLLLTCMRTMVRIKGENGCDYPFITEGSSVRIAISSNWLVTDTFSPVLLYTHAHGGTRLC
jgi:hypothetical protein